MSASALSTSPGFNPDQRPGVVPVPVGAERRLVSELKGAPKPAAARTPMTALATAVAAAWADRDRLGGAERAFIAGVDPILVRNLIQAWPDPDARSAAILAGLARLAALPARELQPVS